MRLPRRPWLALAALCLLTSRSAFAAWSTDPAVNTPFATGSQAQSARSSVSDGTGGMIVGFAEGGDIRALRVDAAGTVRWNVSVCSAAGAQSAPALAIDGAGGAYLAWVDPRSGSSDIYAQHLNVNGSALWAANGLAVCTAAGEQLTPVIAYTSNASAVIAWTDYRSGATSDVFAQVATSAGALGTTANGIAICTAAGDQRGLSICTTGYTGAGVVGVAWQDQRTDAGDIYVQAIAVSGNLIVSQLAANGVGACVVGGTQSAPIVMTDGQYGLLVCWNDARSGTGEVFGQRVDYLGSQRWGLGGTTLTLGTGSEYLGDAVSDGTGGMFVVFSDSRNNATTSLDIYAQHVSASAGPLWGTTGTSVCTNAATQDYPSVALDGTGGVIVAWGDARYDLNGDIFAQRLGPTGTRLWTFDGVAVSTRPSSSSAPAIDNAFVVTPDGDVLFSWIDSWDIFGNNDLYGQRVDHFGVLGSADPVIVSVRDAPNDEGGRVKVSWKASYLDYEPWLVVSEYRLYRSAPPVAALAALRAGADPARFVRVEEPDATTSYWELVATVAAQRSEDYGVVTATTGDSVAGSNPRTLFRVQARSSSGTLWWYSAPDSGYSVDNLPPSTPAALAAQYAGGTTRLTWQPNAEADLAGYRVYRGVGTGFAPSPATLVGAPSDTGFVDAAGAPWVYKVTAVDAHGNESPVATIVPSGTVGAPAPATAALALAAPTPNPARGATVLRWTLPRATRVSLALHDGAGRRVRTLYAGEGAAGEHAASFALVDDAGRALPSGLYFVRMETAGRALARRISVVH